MAVTELVSRFNPLTSHPKIDTDMHIAIIGAGFSGLGMAIRLKEAGVDSFTILERGSEVGGTWRDNHYPGAACDVHSHLYSFSFEQSATWSRSFGQQPEIFDYIKRCTDKYKLRQHVRFNTTIVGADFDEDTGIWNVHTADGETLTANVVVSAVGALADPAWPRIEGLDSFTGKLMHTAQWDDDYDLTGKRVAVIGSGASADGRSVSREGAKHRWSSSEALRHASGGAVSAHGCAAHRPSRATTQSPPPPAGSPSAQLHT